MKSNLEIFHLDDLCRLCLNQLGAVNMFMPVDMTKDIFTTTGVKILISDALPQTICKKCYCLIKDGIKLRSMSQKNDARLRGLMGDPDYSNEFPNHNSRPQEGQDTTPCKPCSSLTSVTLNSSEIQSVPIQYKKTKPLNVQKSSKNNSHVFHNISKAGNISKKKYQKNKKKSLLTADKQDGSNIIKVRNDIYAVSTEMSPKVQTIKTETIETNETEMQVENIVKIEITDTTEYPKENLSINHESIDPNITNHLLVPVKKRSLNDEDQEFTYECDTCLKVFPTRRRLVIHLRNHNKTFICSIVGCEKAFACNHDLQKHIRCHTGEKPYQCEICLRCYTQNSTLKYHKKHVQPCCDYFKKLESKEIILSDHLSLDNTSATEIEKWVPRMPTLEAMLKQPVELQSTIEVQSFSGSSIEVPSLPVVPIEAPSLSVIPIENQTKTEIKLLPEHMEMISEDQYNETAPLSRSEIIDIIGIPETPSTSNTLTNSQEIECENNFLGIGMCSTTQIN